MRVYFNLLDIGVCKMPTIPKYYWETHKRYCSNRRMHWYFEPADKDFWAQYAARQVSRDFYARSESVVLSKHEVGRYFHETLTKPGRHLEAGCGSGFWVTVLNANGYQTEGIEYSDALVQQVLSIRPDLPVRIGNALEIDRPDGYYDSYLSFGVMEHRLEGPEPFLQEAHRVLKPKGTLVVTVPYFGPIRQLKNNLGLYEKVRPDLPFFQYGFKRDEFEELVVHSGFEVQLIRPVGLNRLLIEESAFYRGLMHRRGARIIKKCTEYLLSKFDGHMLLIVARKQ